MDCSALLCGRFADSQESRFQVSKRSNMGCAVLEVDRSADVHEFCFQAAKRSDKVCVELHGCLFDDFYEWHYQVSKRSDNCSSILQERRLADVQEECSGYQTVKYVQCCTGMRLIC